MKYAIWGYTFGVEKTESGKWAIIGHAKGKHPMVLHKVGDSATIEEAQRRLRSWARHVLATPVAVQQLAVAVGSQQGAQMELLPCRSAR